MKIGDSDTGSPHLTAVIWIRILVAKWYNCKAWFQIIVLFSNGSSSSLWLLGLSESPQVIKCGLYMTDFWLPTSFHIDFANGKQVVKVANRDHGTADSVIVRNISQLLSTPIIC